MPTRYLLVTPSMIGTIQNGKFIKQGSYDAGLEFNGSDKPVSYPVAHMYNNRKNFVKDLNHAGIWVNYEHCKNLTPSAPGLPLGNTVSGDGTEGIVSETVAPEVATQPTTIKKPIFTTKNIVIGVVAIAALYGIAKWMKVF